MTSPGITQSALYLRVSTEQQVDGNSLATQESQLLRYAKAHGYAVADIYVDAGLSGKNTNRPELQRMLEDAGRRSFDVVLVWAVDRISRSVPDLLHLIETLREHGVDFAAVSQDFDTSDPTGLLTLHILGSFAQFERELLIERTKEGHLRRLQKSDWSCGVVPFGYSKVDGKLVEVAEEAAVVRRMFDLFLEHKAFNGVARLLSEEGVRTRNGNRWYGNVVKGILRNPVYMGANVYGRHAKGDTRVKPKEEWTVVPGMREPMVDPKTFDAVQAIIDATKPQKLPPASPPSLLAGLVRCGECMSPMYAARNRSGKTFHRYYRCNGSTHLGKDFCSGMSMRADRLEGVVEAKVREVARLGDGADQAQAAREVDDSAAEEHRKLQNAMERVKYRIARVFELYETGELGKADLRERMAKLSAERDRVQAALAASRVHATVQEDGGKAVASYDSLDDAGKREFLRAVIREVIVRGRTVELVLADLGDGDGARFTMSVLPEVDTTTLGGRLKKARLEAGLWQQDVADLLGVHVQSVSNWENGRSRPRRLSIEEIEQAIGAADKQV